MWSRTNINQLILSGGSKTTEEVEQLKKLASEYSYSSIFSLAFLEALYLNEDIRLEEELFQHAFKINNREKLFSLLHQPISKIIEVPVKEEKIESIIEAVPTESVEKGQEVTSSITKEVDELDKLINTSALTSNYSELFLKDLPETSNNLKTNNDQPTETEQDLAVPMEEIPLKEPKTFTEWLKSNSNIEGIEEEKTPTYVKIEKPVTEFYSPQKRAKESVDADKIPVSETLAKVFILQGNYLKAIYIYEQLILSFPEKKVFFASQIKQLNKKISHP